MTPYLFAVLQSVQIARLPGGGYLGTVPAFPEVQAYAATAELCWHVLRYEVEAEIDRWQRIGRTLPTLESSVPPPSFEELLVEMV